MSIEAMTGVRQRLRAWRGLPRRSGARFVWWVIAWHADAAGENAWPSVAELARVTGLSERGVQRALRELERTGDLVVEVGTGPGGVNRYRLSVLRAVEKSVENGGKRGRRVRRLSPGG